MELKDIRKMEYKVASEIYTTFREIEKCQATDKGVQIADQKIINVYLTNILTAPGSGRWDTGLDINRMIWIGKR